MKLSLSIKKILMPSRIMLIVLWLLLLTALAVFADAFIEYDPSFPYADTLLARTQLPRWVYSWANFDGVHYLTIANKGYHGTGLIQAFFPLFPLLLWASLQVSSMTIVAGILLNCLFFGVGLILWWNHLEMKTDDANLARSIIYALLLFPTSFFFFALYTEALFFLLLVLIFRSVEKKRWIQAACLVALASATKIVGVFLVFALVWAFLFGADTTVASIENLRQHVLSVIKGKWLHLLTLIGAASSGLASYMFYLWVVFRNPLLFFTVQAEFGGGRQETLILLPQVLVRYLKILLYYPTFDLIYYASVQELALTLLIGFCLVYGWWTRAIPRYQLVFAIPAFLLPTITGTLSSMPRYVLVCLPAIWALSHILQRYPKIKILWFVCSTIVLVFNTILFVQGYWVA